MADVMEQPGSDCAVASVHEVSLPEVKSEPEGSVGVPASGNIQPEVCEGHDSQEPCEDAEDRTAKQGNGLLKPKERWLQAALTDDDKPAFNGATDVASSDPPFVMEVSTLPAEHLSEHDFRSIPEFVQYLENLRESTSKGKARFAGLTTAEEYEALLRVRREQDIHKLRKRGKRDTKSSAHGEMPGDPQRRHMLRSGGWELVEDGLGGRPVLTRQNVGGGLLQIWVYEGNVERYLWEIHSKQLGHAGMDRTWAEVQGRLYGCTQSICRQYIAVCPCSQAKDETGATPSKRQKTSHGRGGRGAAGSDASALASRILPARRVNLTQYERESILMHRQANPRITQSELIQWSFDVFGKRPSQPMISKIIRTAEKARKQQEEGAAGAQQAQQQGGEAPAEAPAQPPLEPPQLPAVAPAEGDQGRHPPEPRPPPPPQAVAPPPSSQAEGAPQDPPAPPVGQTGGQQMAPSGSGPGPAPETQFLLTVAHLGEGQPGGQQPLAEDSLQGGLPTQLPPPVSQPEAGPQPPPPPQPGAKPEGAHPGEHPPRVRQGEPPPPAPSGQTEGLQQGPPLVPAAVHEGMCPELVSEQEAPQPAQQAMPRAQQGPQDQPPPEPYPAGAHQRMSPVLNVQSGGEPQPPDAQPEGPSGEQQLPPSGPPEALHPPPGPAHGGQPEAPGCQEQQAAPAADPDGARGGQQAAESPPAPGEPAGPGQRAEPEARSPSPAPAPGQHEQPTAATHAEAAPQQPAAPGCVGWAHEAPPPPTGPGGAGCEPHRDQAPALGHSEEPLGPAAAAELPGLHGDPLRSVQTTEAFPHDELSMLTQPEAVHSAPPLPGQQPVLPLQLHQVGPMWQHGLPAHEHHAAWPDMEHGHPFSSQGVGSRELPPLLHPVGVFHGHGQMPLVYTEGPYSHISDGRPQGLGGEQMPPQPGLEHEPLPGEHRDGHSPSVLTSEGCHWGAPDQLLAQAAMGGQSPGQGLGAVSVSLPLHETYHPLQEPGRPTELCPGGAGERTSQPAPIPASVPVDCSSQATVTQAAASESRSSIQPHS